MEIIVKASSGAETELPAVVGRLAASVGLARATLSKIFPDVTKGNRARMFHLELPDDTPAPSVTALLNALRTSSQIEYADEPTPKHPARSKMGR